MKIEWSSQAYTSLVAIFDYIAKEDYNAAANLLDHVESATSSLIKHRGLGRPGRVTGTRELILADSPYIVVYQVTQDNVFILDVLHGARKWPENF